MEDLKKELSSEYFDFGCTFYDANFSQPVDESDRLNPAGVRLYPEVNEFSDESDSLFQFVPVLLQQLIKFLD